MYAVCVCVNDASPTPHGDGNPKSLYSDSATLMHPLPLTGTAKKGFPGHWSGKSFFTDLIELMIFFYAFAAGHPLARSFFIAVILQ